MNTLSLDQAVKELRSMAAQILSPNSNGKHFFNSVADMIEQEHSNRLQREVQLHKALDDLTAERALRERADGFREELASKYRRQSDALSEAKAHLTTALDRAEKAERALEETK